MSKEIKTSQVVVEANVKAISGATKCFEPVALNPSDNRTTITANAKGQEAYARCQSVKQNFGNSIKQEMSKLRSVGVMFQQYDEMLSELWETRFGKNK